VVTEVARHRSSVKRPRRLFPLQLSHDVVLSVVIVHVEEWSSGIVSALPIHDEILEQGAAA
jgi:hypothetical protein